MQKEQTGALKNRTLKLSPLHGARALNSVRPIPVGFALGASRSTFTSLTGSYPLFFDLPIRRNGLLIR